MGCCYNCTIRHMGCHAECKDYIKEVKQREMERELIFTAKENEYYPTHKQVRIRNTSFSKFFNSFNRGAGSK